MKEVIVLGAEVSVCKELPTFQALAGQSINNTSQVETYVCNPNLICKELAIFGSRCSMHDTMQQITESDQE